MYLMYHHALSVNIQHIRHMCMSHPHHVCPYQVFILYFFELLVLFSPYRAADLHIVYCIVVTISKW